MWSLKNDSKKKQEKWYAVMTAFIDGKLLESRCCFIDENSMVGCQIASHSEQPMNCSVKEFFGRIQINTDWFESIELAKAFSEGKITYIHHYDAYYKASINSTLTQYRSRELVEVCEEKGIMPYIGIHKYHKLETKPYWA